MEPSLNTDIPETEDTSENPSSELPQDAKYIFIERRAVHDTLFQVDDSHFRSSMPSPTHWSIAWSDLMMTMFVLFLSLFVYKTANEDFLREHTLEVVGGDTTDALQSDLFEQTGVPFAPISPALPLMTAGEIKENRKIDLEDINIDSPFTGVAMHPEPPKEIVEVPVDSGLPIQPGELQKSAIVLEQPSQTTPRVQGRERVQPRPLISEKRVKPGKIQDIYRMGKEALEKNNLKKFASIDLIPDSAVRIILTGDLLFETGQATLDNTSREKLEQLAKGIQDTPYIINVVGHTDNVPMFSEQYASNWELSVARASTVARFLINEMNMKPNQFVVSGYSSYRPLVPNTNIENRKKNRRVEIIISKRLPKPVAAGSISLQ